MENIILIGPMGAGKSSIGRRLARDLCLPFLDVDQAIQERTGVDIGFIFEKEGEEGFRQREEACLKELTAAGTAVIATGGGAVLSEASRRCMQEHGVVVFLETSVDWQLARTRRGTHRPLLEADDPRERLETLYHQRLPLYREIANVTVQTDGQRVGAVASAVRRALNELGFDK